MLLQRLKTISRLLLAAFFIVGGVMHFVASNFYVQLMPDYLPWHLELVYLSGVAEAILGAMLFLPRYSTYAAWGVIALLIAVFPANVFMATHHVQFTNLPSWMSQPSPTAAWMRLPFQGVFILWAYWHTKRDSVTGLFSQAE